MKALRIALLCVCVAPAAAEIPHPACEPSQAAAEFLDPSRGRGFEFLLALHDALTSHPDDVYLHRMFQDKYPDGGDDLLRRYRDAAAARPDDPAALYLYGRLQAQHDDVGAEETLRAALALDPDYPWAHLALARFYQRVRPDAEQTRIHLAAAIDQCPTTEMFSDLIGELPPADVAERGTALRSRLAATRNPMLAAGLREVWTAELRESLPDAQESFRDRIRADLTLLRAPELAADERCLDAMIQGYSIVGDDRGLEWAILETGRRFPNNPLARQAAFGRFFQQHRSPESCDPVANREYNAELADAARKWLELWPDDPGFLLWHLTALVRVPGTSDEDLNAAVDRLLSPALQAWDMQGSLALNAAALLLNYDRALERVPALVEPNVTRSAERGLPMLVQARLRLGDVDGARSAFARLESELSMPGKPQSLSPEETIIAHRKSAIELVLRYQPLRCGVDDPAADRKVVSALVPDGAEALAWTPSSVPPRRMRPEVDEFQPRRIVLPDFELQDLSGRVWRPSDLEGKVTLVQVWQSDMVWTRETVAWIEDLRARLGQRSDVVLLTVALDEDVAKLETLVRNRGITVPVLPARTLAQNFRPEPSPPWTWIVDRTGTTVSRLCSRLSGDQDAWTEAALRAIDEVGR